MHIQQNTPINFYKTLNIIKHPIKMMINHLNLVKIEMRIKWKKKNYKKNK